MASASVHLAVLVIAKDAARGDLAAGDVVATRAAAAGHRVISRQSVDDSEAAIRSHLARWIDDRQVDVVVVLSGGSPIVKKTLATLVTEPVPGFSDAVRCGSTYVFIVPGAAGPGMDKQVLPYLDAAKPDNLLAQIPRLHAPAEGVPVPIAPEKTEGGSGVPARMPASVSTRAKQKTGANVIARNKPANDPPTKPIDVARLERQLAKSTTPSHDDVTRPEIALILPRLPPGATEEPTDEDDDDDDVGDHTTTDTLAVQPAPPLPPAGSPRTRPPSGSAPTVVPRTTTKPAEPKPFSFSTPLRGGPPAQRRERTSSGTPGYQARDSKPPLARDSKPVIAKPAPASTSAATPPVPYVAAKPAPTPPREQTAAGTPAYSAKDAKPRSAAPSTPPPIQPWRAKSTSSGTPAYPAVTPPPPPAEPPVEDIEEIDPDGTDADDIDDAENEEKWAATIAAAKAEAEAAAATAEADAAAARAEAAKAEADAAAAKAAAAKAQADAVAAKAKTDAVVEVPEVKVEAPPPARVRQPTPPPPPAVRPARTPTAPPPLRVSDSDLPRGAFTYPEVPRRSNVALKVVAALGVTVLGFFAVVYFLDKKDAPKDQVATVTPPTPIDAPVAVAVAVAPDAAEPEIDITPTPTPTTTTTPTPTPTTRPRPGTSTPASRPVTTPKTGSDQGATTAAPEPTPVPTPPVAEADLCDEANCVLSDYDRPCCAKYKAKGPVISQRIGGVPQTLDRSMVRSGVDGIKPRVIKCGEKAGVNGTVKIAVSVSPDGAVTGADVQDTPDAALGACVAGALRSAKFGKSVDGGSFTYPFVF